MGSAFPVIILTHTSRPCACATIECVLVLASMCVRAYVCVSSSLRVSSEFTKHLGVGVYSCVYSAHAEIVSELRKQFTVNKAVS